MAQDSQLGLQIDETNISSIGLADDSCLLSDSIFNLNLLLHLTIVYCKKYFVELVPEKTKLLCFSPRNLEAAAFYWKLVSPLKIGAKSIEFCEEAEHVGIIRSVNGNLAHIFGRISAHNAALRSVLPAGLARGHRGNPAASLRIQVLYAVPRLLSGMAALVISNSERNILHKHYKYTLEKLQRLHSGTPEVVVFLLGGSLPFGGVLDMRLLTLFGMICRLGDSNLLYKVAHSTLSKPVIPTKSWFMHIQHLCTQYSLPHPLTLLLNPPTKTAFKNLTKSKIYSYWEAKLPG